MIDKSRQVQTNHNLPILTVGEVSAAVKSTIEGTFSRVRIRGEISGFKRAASGHLYLALKDENAVLDGVCWRGVAARLSLDPEDGMEVLATGRLTTYPGRSKYQIVIESMDLAGQGALLKLLEDRRRKLAEEGLFDPGAKQDIPFLPELIGVITSPTGAVISDILHRLADRFPRRVLLWPVPVQGDGAAEKIAAAIKGFNALAKDGPVPRPDLLIVARGGGSLEDLMAFNEEAPVRAAAASTIPIISAVGHETDTTLMDHAADLRAPTPTAAAEMAVPVRMDLMARTAETGLRLTASMNRLIGEARVRIEGLARGLPHPRRIAEDAAQKLDDWGERLELGLQRGLERNRSRLSQVAARLSSPQQKITLAGSRLAGEARALERAGDTLLRNKQARFGQASALLESYSYEQTLKRGFALVRDARERPVTSMAAIKPGDRLSMEFHDGKVGAIATGDGGKPKRPPGPKKPDKRQGSLL